jgi:hypothetical protein
VRKLPVGLAVAHAKKPRPILRILDDARPGHSMSKPVNKKRLLSKDDGRAQLKFIGATGRLNLPAKVRYFCGNDFLADNYATEAAAIKAGIVDVVDSYVAMRSKKAILANDHRIAEFKKWVLWKFPTPELQDMVRPIIKEWLGLDI